MRWLAIIPLTIGLGLLLSRWQIPAAWVLAGILGAGLVALITGNEVVLDPRVSTFGRGFIGVIAAMPLLATSPSALLPFILPALVVTIVSVGTGLAAGMAMAKIQPVISPETALLATLPGGASVISSMAKDFGADVSFVALTQYLRVLIISVSLPLITALFSPELHPLPAGDDNQPWWVVVVLCVIVISGNRIGTALRLPASVIMGPLLLTVAFGLIYGQFVPPSLLSIFAFITIGWICGGGISIPSLKFFAKQLPATMGFIAVLLITCAGIAVLLVPLLDISYFEAYLATSPGALESVLAIAAEGNAGPVVVAIQIIRLVIVLVLVGYFPALLRLLSGCRKS